MKVLATAGDEKKLEIATKLGAEKTVNYKTHDFSKELEGRRVNLILDCVGGSYWKQNMKVILKQFNYFILIQFIVIIYLKCTSFTGFIS